MVQWVDHRHGDMVICILCAFLNNSTVEEYSSSCFLNNTQEMSRGDACAWISSPKTIKSVRMIQSIWI